MSAAGPDAVPDYDPLALQLARVDRVVREQLWIAWRRPRRGTCPRSRMAEQLPWVRSKSRQDAIRALDAVAEFFRRNEPSSPIPLFLERAKRAGLQEFP
jgi:type VI secretion system protein ImpA